MSKKDGMIARQEYCRKELRKILKPGQTAYCILRSVSRSGMKREISLYIIQKGELQNIDCLAADATGHTLGKVGIVVHGCGMDMGFGLVYSLGYAVWPKGTRNGGTYTCGGYALKHEWI